MKGLCKDEVNIAAICHRDLAIYFWVNCDVGITTNSLAPPTKKEYLTPPCKLNAYWGVGEGGRYLGENMFLQGCRAHSNNE